MEDAVQKLINVSGESVELEIPPGVFVPTEHGMIYARYLGIKPGDRVLDVGTGSGFLAILAAKKGGTVTALDSDEESILCAQANAKCNDVEIEFIKSDLLDSMHQRSFDLAIANLPIEDLPNLSSEQLPPYRRHSLIGGVSGSDVTLRFLQQIVECRHRTIVTNVLLVIGTICDYKKIIRYAAENYKITWLAFIEVPTKPFVAEFLEFYKHQSEIGVMHVFRRDGVWRENKYVLLLTRK